MRRSRTTDIPRERKQRERNYLRSSKKKRWRAIRLRMKFRGARRIFHGTHGGRRTRRDECTYGGDDGERRRRSDARNPREANVRVRSERRISEYVRGIRHDTDG